jgi:hypothetical protein
MTPLSPVRVTARDGAARITATGVIQAQTRKSLDSEA